MILRIGAMALALSMVCCPTGCIESEGVIVHTETQEAIIKEVITEKPIETEEVAEEDAKTEEVAPNKVSLGVCKLTAYCKENYPHICNNGDGNITATGTVPTVGRTVAVDPSVIPYGSKVIINGHTYIAEDCGGAIKGNKIDILFATHKEALQFGVQYAEVFVIY